MSDPIRTLAHFLTLKKSTDQKFVLMLGAGASLTSGVKTTAAIMEELVQSFGASTSASTEEQFDELWRMASRDTRRDMLQPYLVDGKPSEGYRYLVDLIVRGFFDVVITFNFDRLLERALDDANFRDYKVVIRGETRTEELERLVAEKEPRVKILKMHGSLQSSDYFLFSSLEMLNYPEEIRTLLLKLTGRDIIICGYGFNDKCVERAFNDSEDSGDIYYVNPGGAGPNIRPYLIRRRSKDRAISGDLGRFDNFCRALNTALTKPVEPVPARQRQNLFKFLDHYQEEHKAWFFGRRRLTRILLEQFDTARPSLLFLYGNPKVGKTSFIRAGLIPYLTPDRYECIYVRGKRDLEPQLRVQLAARFGQALATLDWDAIGARLKDATPKHIVLFVDQLEKFARAWEDSRENQAAMLQFITSLFAQAGPRLSIVGVSVHEMQFWHLLAKLPSSAREAPHIEIERLEPAMVASIIRHAARISGTAFSPDVLKEICNDKGLATLTHVQTVCYYMAKGYYSSWQGYEMVTDQGLLAALESIKEEASLIDLIDDLPDQERRLIRSFLKIICEPTGNTRKIVDFIRKHFPDIKEDRFPEPLE